MKTMRPFRSLKPLGFKVISFLLLSVFLLLAGKGTAYAAGEEYTYTVRLYVGNQGELKDGGIQVSSESARVDQEKGCTVISGLKYGDTVYIRPQDAAEVTDPKYYVKGVRRSGRDNSEAEAPTFHVACDRDYVVAYGIRGDQVAYRVDYLDEAGNKVMESDTYYGNIGERQYVSSRYVDGYQPQTLNLVKTLSTNEAENVFEFRYSQNRDLANPGTEGTGTGADANGTEAAGAGAGEDAGDAGAGGTDIPGDEGLTGGDVGVDIPDGQVPLGQQDVVDLDDGEVPLADIVMERSQLRIGNLPIYVGVGVADVIALVVAVVYLKRKQRVQVKKDTDKEKHKGRK